MSSKIQNEQKLIEECKRNKVSVRMTKNAQTEIALVQERQVELRQKLQKLRQIIDTNQDFSQNNDKNININININNNNNNNNNNNLSFLKHCLNPSLLQLLEFNGILVCAATIAGLPPNQSQLKCNKKCCRQINTDSKQNKK